MKHISLTLLLLLFVLAGCGKSAEASRARENATKALESLALSLEAGWSSLEIEAGRLEAQAKASGTDLSSAIRQAIANADVKAAEAKRLLLAAAEAGADDAKESLQHARRAIDDASTALAKAWAQLGK